MSIIGKKVVSLNKIRCISTIKIKWILFCIVFNLQYLCTHIMTWMTSYFPITNPTLIFFVVLCIILFAPIVMGKLRIPHIIGMVLAGVLVGKYGLDILERDSSFELFGKVGLYYIMFLAGLEMDMEGVKKNKGHFLVFGGLTFAVPFILTYIMAMYLLHYTPIASLLLGCIMASNTLVAYPIISRYGLQRNDSVTLSVGSSMISLLMSLVVLAAIVGAFSKSGDGMMFWVLFPVKFFAFCAGSVWLIPKLARWFLRRYSDSIMQFIFVLAILFLSAALSEAIGLEGIFGAFFSGLILNRYIPHVSPLMNRLEFIGNALFIPYFLIGVGMLINLRTLFSGFTMVYTVLLIVIFGTLGKALAAYLSSFILKKSLLSGHMMFGLTSAHAAGAIAMVMVGMTLEVAPGQFMVSTYMLNGVVVMILFTCIISSFMTENTAKRIILEEKTHLSHADRDKDDEKILLCVKYPEIAPQLAELAIMMRNPQLNRGVIALNVVYDDDYSSVNREQGLRLLEKLQKQAAASDVNMQTQVRLATNIANGIKHAFTEYAASEIIMGMHVHTEVSQKFWGQFIQSLYNGLNRQIVLIRFVQPLNTLRLIEVAVPSRAEFEPGFHRWLERLCRMAGNLECRINFHARQDSLTLIAEYIHNLHADVRAEFTAMTHWNELPQLAATIKEDHLFVVVTARKGTVSYKSALDRLPDELTEHFSGKNLMIIFPDQYGDSKEDSMTFAEAQHQEELSIYQSIRQIIKNKKVKLKKS